jgi:hypothetical protein
MGKRRNDMPHKDRHAEDEDDDDEVEEIRQALIFYY